MSSPMDGGSWWIPTWWTNIDNSTGGWLGVFTITLLVGGTFPLIIGFVADLWEKRFPNAAASHIPLAEAEPKVKAEDVAAEKKAGAGANSAKGGKEASGKGTAKTSSKSSSKKAK